jgi:hypothetical protein
MTNDTASLDRLHDIIVPAPVPWWPPAPGWYWVLGFVLIVVLVLAARIFLRWQHNRYRREALTALARVEHQLKRADCRPAGLLELSVLLKRTALTAFPREQVATLTGRSWFAFLDRTAKGSHFSAGPGMALETAIYDPRTADTLDDQKLYGLTAAIRHWIKHHQAEVEQEETKATENRSGNKPFRLSPPSARDSSVQKQC